MNDIMYNSGGGEISKNDKLIARLKSKPRNFTFDEAKSLLESFGYVMSPSGKQAVPAFVLSKIKRYSVCTSHIRVKNYLHPKLPKCLTMQVEKRCRRVGSKKYCHNELNSTIVKN